MSEHKIGYAWFFENILFSMTHDLGGWSQPTRNNYLWALGSPMLVVFTSSVWFRGVYAGLVENNVLPCFRAGDVNSSDEYSHNRAFYNNRLTR